METVETTGEVQKTPQEIFEAKYVSSTEIAERLGVNRTSVLYAHRNGKLPEPIVVNNGQLYLWERETVLPYVERWEQSLQHRRGVAI